MNTDSDRDYTPIWFKAPLDYEPEATCSICLAIVLPGEIVAEDGAAYVHEDCCREEIENAD